MVDDAVPTRRNVWEDFKRENEEVAVLNIFFGLIEDPEEDFVKRIIIVEMMKIILTINTHLALLVCCEWFC